MPSPSLKEETFNIKINEAHLANLGNRWLRFSEILKSRMCCWGELVMIVGPVASGKSSALMALLNEIPVGKAEKLAVRGSLAYVGQQPWIFSDTLKENITFGKTFERSRYEEVNL